MADFSSFPPIIFSGMVFNRSTAKTNGIDRVLGIGHKLFDASIIDAKKLDDLIASLPHDLFEQPLLVFQITDRITSEENVNHHPVIVGYRPSIEDRDENITKDWELLQLLNALPLRKEVFRIASVPTTNKHLVHTWIGYGSHCPNHRDQGPCSRISYPRT